MTFRVALAVAVLVAVSGVAHAQSLQAQPVVDRVVVHIDGKPLTSVRAELARAAEAVCRSRDVFIDGRDVTCVDSTYAAALRQAKSAFAAGAGAPALTQVATR